MTSEFPFSQQPYESEADCLTLSNSIFIYFSPHGFSFQRCGIHCNVERDQTGTKHTLENHYFNF